VTTAWTAAAAAFALAVTGVGIALAWSVPTAPHAVLVALVYPSVGALVVTRQPRNTIGWLLIGIGLVNSLVAVANPWAPVALDVAPGVLPGGRALGQVMAWLGGGLWILSHGTLLALVPLLFPDGRLPSKRWAPVLVFNIAAVAVQFAAPLSLVSQVGLLESYDEVYPDERLASRLGELGYDLVRIAAVLAIVALVWRLVKMRRDERGPYVWFAAGAIAAGVLLIPLELITHPLPYEIVRLLSVVTIPIGAAVAILHRRVYGIDVVVNRTLVYAVLTAALAAVYLGSVAAVDQLVSVSSTFSAVIAAGATAIVLSPLRQQVQVAVNRLIYGQRDEAHVIAAAVGSRLEAVASGPETLNEVTRHIATALRLPFVAVQATTGSDGPRRLAATGEPRNETERLALVANGELVGELVVATRRGQGRLSPRDLAALREVAPAIGAAVRQIQLAEDLRRARGRLANVLEEERRRIRRDLHDGLGPSLATVVMGLEEARAVHRDDPERTERLLEDLKDHTRGAIEEIRSLVYGLRPPALDELGLRAALEQLVHGTIGRTAIDVNFEAPDTLSPLAAATEVAAYRIVQEALTNVVRHSRAIRASVAVWLTDDSLTIEVSDDGGGMPEPLLPGVGITSMRERVEDIGGTIGLSGPPGTTVRVTLPKPAP